MGVRVILDFNRGYLEAPDGTALRTYLSERLHCDPMRITKKFTGDSCIGKRVFHPAVRCGGNAALIDGSRVSYSSFLLILLYSYILFRLPFFLLRKMLFIESLEKIRNVYRNTNQSIILLPLSFFVLILFIS